MVVCHSCDNPSCINPNHLWLGTQNDNIKDMFNKKRDWFSKGLKNSKTSLNKEEVEEIKKNYIPHKTLQKDLAIKYGVSLPTIQRAISGNYAYRSKD